MGKGRECIRERVSIFGDTSRTLTTRRKPHKTVAHRAKDLEQPRFIVRGYEPHTRDLHPSQVNGHLFPFIAIMYSAIGSAIQGRAPAGKTRTAGVHLPREASPVITARPSKVSPVPGTRRGRSRSDPR